MESDHLPVTLTLQLSTRAPQAKDETEKVRWLEKLVCDKEKVLEFLEALTSASAQAAISHASAFASVDINVALDVFVGCLEKASRCMVRKIKVSGTRKSADRFDLDCFIQRKLCRAKLRRYK